MRLIESHHTPLSPAASDRQILQWLPSSLTLIILFSNLCALNIFLAHQSERHDAYLQLLSNQDTLLRFHLHNFINKSIPSKSFDYECTPLAATLNQGLLMSAEEKVLKNRHHAHISYVGCSSCEYVVQADALHPQ